MIGENPIFSPGTVHRYASCTSFIDEKYSTMEGHYTMRYLHHCEFMVNICMYIRSLTWAVHKLYVLVLYMHVHMQSWHIVVYDIMAYSGV